MVLLLFLSLPCLLVVADKTDTKNDMLLKHLAKPLSFQDRDLSFTKSSSFKYDNSMPMYYSFMKSLNGSETITQCKEKGFSCVQFPADIVEYLKSVGETEVINLGTFPTAPAADLTLKTYTGPTKNLFLSNKKLSAYILKFSDPEWWKQWHLQDYRTTKIPVMDHNVVPVLNMGITGNGVTVAILGEGIMNHPDFGNSFDAGLSHDFCNNRNQQYPNYKFTLNGYLYDSEGNYSAGLIAMQGGNNICGVGIAPNVKIAAYKTRKCESPTSDFYNIDTQALSYQMSTISIYCTQWTSSDVIGNRLIELNNDIENSLKRGITEGRDRKGAVYVFSSGRNRATNNCATNGYVNSLYTITIASANQAGKPASYSERCSAVFATAYSGDVDMDGLATIDANGQCATYFTKRPAGPAIASGIIALMLEAKPSLTYRDVMHIITMTAEVAPLADNEDTWYRNGRGFWVSNDFGFGLLNAENMVKLAKNWKTVPDKNICLLRKKLREPIYFDHKEDKVITLDASVCKGKSSGMTYLEHVEVRVTAQFTCRGAMNISLTSPGGTNTQLLEPRVRDFTPSGLKNWNLISIQNWGENPKGDWKVTFKALQIHDEDDPHGHIEEVEMTLHGTQNTPENYPRKYAAFRLPNGKTNQY